MLYLCRFELSINHLEIMEAWLSRLRYARDNLILFRCSSNWCTSFSHYCLSLIIWHVGRSTHHTKEDSKEEVAFVVSWAGWISLQDKHIALISMNIRSCAVWVALVILDQFSTVKTLSFVALIFLWGVVSVFFCHQCFKWIFFVFSVWEIFFLTVLLIIFLTFYNMRVFFALLFFLHFFFVYIESPVDFL